MPKSFYSLVEFRQRGRERKNERPLLALIGPSKSWWLGGLGRSRKGKNVIDNDRYQSRVVDYTLSDHFPIAYIKLVLQSRSSPIAATLSFSPGCKLLESHLPIAPRIRVLLCQREHVHWRRRSTKSVSLRRVLRAPTRDP